ncbi:MAG: hypothetical protein AAF799_46655 [Myxococcota bacterium]
MAEVDDDPKRTDNAALINQDKELDAFIDAQIAKFDSNHVKYGGETLGEVMLGIKNDGLFPLENAIIRWLRKDRKEGKHYTKGVVPGQKSKYRCKYAFVEWLINVTLADVVRVGGTLIGTDKIGHYFVQGYQYWDVFSKTGSDKKAKALGESQEASYYGILVSGIYSTTDLVANEAGLALWKRIHAFVSPLVADPNAVTKAERQAIIEKFRTFKVGFSKEVTPQWNEFTNLSRVSKSMRGWLDQAGTTFHGDAKYYRESLYS